MNLVTRDAEVRQLGLPAARPRRRPRRGQGGRAGHGDHVASSTAYPAEILGGLEDGVLAAGDGQRLRDDRLRRHAQPRRSRSTKVVFPDGHDGEPFGKQARARAFEDGVTAKATRHPRAEHHRAAPARARTSAARRPARPARPTTTPTRGSSASRRTSRPSVWVGFPKQPHRDVPADDADLGGRRHVPGADLGRVHEAGQARLRRLPAAEDAVHGRAVLRPLRLDRRPERRRRPTTGYGTDADATPDAATGDDRARRDPGARRHGRRRRRPTTPTSTRRRRSRPRTPAARPATAATANANGQGNGNGDRRRHG